MGEKFRIVRPLAEADMGALFVAEPVAGGDRVAVKVLHEDIVPEDLHAEFIAAVRPGTEDEHVVRVVDSGIDAGSPWFAMELLEGEHLAARIEREGARPIAELLALASQIAAGLADAHAAGSAHGALTPENVFLAPLPGADPPYLVKLRELGYGRFVVQVFGSQGELIGVPAWMAPEQFRVGSAPEPAADIWALGLLSFFVLTGRSYWKAAADPATPLKSQLREIVVEPLEAASARADGFGLAGKLPPWFDDWFSLCVARAPSERFSTIGQAVAELRAAIDADAASAEAQAEARPNSGAKPPTSAADTKKTESAKARPNTARPKGKALPGSSSAPAPASSGRSPARRGAQSRGSEAAPHSEPARKPIGSSAPVSSKKPVVLPEPHPPPSHRARRPVASADQDAPTSDLGLPRDPASVEDIDEITTIWRGPSSRPVSSGFPGLFGDDELPRIPRSDPPSDPGDSVPPSSGERASTPSDHALDDSDEEIFARSRLMVADADEPEIEHRLASDPGSIPEHDSSPAVRSWTDSDTDDGEGADAVAVAAAVGRGEPDTDSRDSDDDFAVPSSEPPSSASPSSIPPSSDPSPRLRAASVAKVDSMASRGSPSALVWWLLGGLVAAGIAWWYWTAMQREANPPPARPPATEPSPPGG